MDEQPEQPIEPQMITPEQPPVQPASKPGRFAAFYRAYAKTLWIGLLSMALLVGGLLAYLLFFRHEPPAPLYEGDVKIIVAAPKESASGSQLRYEINFENASSAKLTNVALEIFYPRGFTFLNSEPRAQDAGQHEAGSQGREYAFADMGAGEKQTLTVVGTLEGSVQEIKNISVKLHYVPENFRSSFAATASAVTVVLAPDLSLHVDAPAQIFEGQTIHYQIQISNISGTPFSDLVLSAAYPDKFQFKNSEPPPKDEKDPRKWSFGSLAVGESRTVDVYGKIFSGQGQIVPPGSAAGQDSLIQAELFIKKQGEEFSVARSYAFTSVLPSPLALTQTLDAPAVLTSGQALHYKIDYKNTGQTGLSDVTVSLIFDNPVVDLSRVSGLAAQVKKNTIVFLPAQLPELHTVNPGQDGSFDFTLPVLKTFSSSQKNPVLKTRVEFVSKELPEAIAGNTQEFKIASSLTLEAKVVYVSGPEKPKAHETTVYRVELAVNNTVNDLENTVLTATLPRVDTVFQDNSVEPAEERDNVQFVSSSGLLKWNLSKVFAFSGSFLDARTLSFNLAVTPETDNPGSRLNLLSDISVSGTDSFAAVPISSEKIANLTTQ